MVLRDSTPRVGSVTDNYGSEGQVHFRFSEGQPGDPEMTMSPHGGRHGHNGCLVRSKGAARSENTGQLEARPGADLIAPQALFLGGPFAVY